MEPSTPKFLELVSAVAKSTAFPYPNLKPYFIAQCILECGRGSTKLFADFSNPFGMHYHDFMKTYATSVSYDACDGVAIYAKFTKWEDVVFAYFNWFKEWDHYAGWEAHTKDGLDFLTFIGQFYCPPGFTQSWIDAHGGLNYAQYITQKLLPEAKTLLANVTPDPDPKPVPADKDLTVTWFEFNRRTSNGESTVTAYAGNVAKYTHKVTTIADLWTWSQHFPNAQNCPVADTATKVIPKVPDFGEVGPDPKPEPVRPKTPKTDFIPFAKKSKAVMPTKSVQDPKYFIVHWTAGTPESTIEDTLQYGKENGYTFMALSRDGILGQSVPTNAGGYHVGNASVSSFECLGVEVCCAGRLEKVGDLYVPWFAKNSDGSINKARCIPADQVIYDKDNDADDESFEGYYQKYSDAQMKTLTKLALYLHEAYDIAWENIRGHDMVATPKGRKTDPGFSIGEGGMTQFRKNVKALWDSGKRWDTI